MDEIRDALRKFNDDRDWEQFHTPKTWLNPFPLKRRNSSNVFSGTAITTERPLCDEIADVMMYCIMLSDKIGADIKEEIFRKMKKNAEKYPVEKSRGNSCKYDKWE